MQVHPLTYLAKLNIEMNMAELLGKVAKKSSEQRASVPTADIYQTQPDMGALDRELLESGKGTEVRNGGGGEAQAVQDINMDVLGRADEASTSAKQEGVERATPLRVDMLEEGQLNDRDGATVIV